MFCTGGGIRHNVFAVFVSMLQDQDLKAGSISTRKSQVKLKSLKMSSKHFIEDLKHTLKSKECTCFYRSTYFSSNFSQTRSSNTGLLYFEYNAGVMCASASEAFQSFCDKIQGFESCLIFSSKLEVP